MTPAEAAVVLAYINQIDPLVPINDTTTDVWWEALKRNDPTEATWCIKDYYANTKPGWDGRVPPLTPAALRARISDTQARTAAKQRALEPPVKKNPRQTWRDRNPGLWDRLYAEGQAKHRADLAHRGIPLQPHQQPPSVFTIPKPTQADLSHQKDAA